MNPATRTQPHPVRPAQHLPSAWLAGLLGAGTFLSGPVTAQAPKPATPEPAKTTAPTPTPDPTPVAPGRQEPQQVGVGRITLDSHDEATSRELFSACDRDSDDRLDLFEATDALDTLGDPKESSGFLDLDTNRDGYIQWPEFDKVFHRAIEHTKTFRVRTCRRFVKQAPEQQEARQATPLEVFLKLHDQNENGGLDPDEISTLVREIKLNPMFEPQLRMLDVDQSGRVEAGELAPVFEQIRRAVALPGMAGMAPESTLPPPWNDIDGNGDGAIDLAELNAALRRLDPGLARWAKTLLAQLDKDGDQKLGATEIPGVHPAAGATPPPAGTAPPKGTTGTASKNGSS
ncbi:MAG: hypothetical protein NXI31_21195 [bacterium]|nr:hypothetical protein [bacterium]